MIKQITHDVGLPSKYLLATSKGLSSPAEEGNDDLQPD